jgi:hypothetical protein
MNSWIAAAIDIINNDTKTGSLESGLNNININISNINI